jgi:uncharacterized protein
MPSFPDLIILFTRYPHPGKCKTRLIPQLGTKKAALIHRQLTAHTMKTLADFFTWNNNTEFIIYHDIDSIQKMKKWLGSHYLYKEQQGKDLGQRMADALLHGLNKKQNCILLGSDCPDITQPILTDALQALKQKDIVLGPAHDGGYYLIGMAGSVNPDICNQLFKDIPWGGDTVFAKTLRQVEKLGLDSHILKKLHDIDTVEDLKHFHHCSHPE